MDRLKSRIVGPEGPMDAKICLIGQSPGVEEDSSGKPFRGPSGNLLDRSLRAVGLNRNSILINNVFSQRPPNDKVEYFFEDKKKTKLTWEGQEHVEVLRLWLEGLLRRREELCEGPNILVALGSEATYILTGKLGITKWRGSVLPCTLVPGFKVYPTFHPSRVLRSMSDKREDSLVLDESKSKKKLTKNYYLLFLKDLERIGEQAESPTLTYPVREGRVIETLSDALIELEKLKKDNTCVAVDIETIRGIDGPLLWMIGFSPSPDYGFTIPFIKKLRPCWTIQEEMKILRSISEIFLSPKVTKVFQNGSYDLSILGRYYGLRVANDSFEDTMLCHHASYPTMPKGLDTLASIYTWEPYYKDDGKVHDFRRSSDLAEAQYNIKDICVTREIYPKIAENAKQLGVYEGYKRTLYIFPSLLYMQIRGVKIDLELKDKLGKDFMIVANKALLKIKETLGYELNIKSPKQLSSLLYGAFGLPIQYDHKTKKPTTNTNALNRLLRLVKPNSDEENVIEAIKEYKKYIKLISTYTEMEIDSDGRIHTSYNIISTFRLSSSESHFGKGGNVQNIPVRTAEGKMVRRLFKPDPGLELTGADGEQAEAREVAWMAGDTRLIELFQTPGYDVHWAEAKRLFDIPKEVPYNPDALYKSRIVNQSYTLKWYRRIGKTVKHATNYKMGPYMLQSLLMQEGVYLPFGICKTLLLKVRSDNPLLVQWQNKTIETLHATRIIVTPLGRKRIFMGRLDEEAERSAIAFSPQSTVGEITQLGGRALQINLAKAELNADLLMNIHDENIIQNRVEDRKLVYPIIRESMEITHRVNGRDLTIPIAMKRGTNWGELEEFDFRSEI